MFTDFAPKLTGNPDKLDNGAYMMGGPGFTNTGKWSGSYRGFFAYPFPEFTLIDGTTLKNIVLFIYKVPTC